MSGPDETNVALDNGATVVITHRVREGAIEGYEAWLNEIGPICRAYPGHLDWQIIRPVSGLSGTFTVVIRFDTRPHLESWINSTDRKRLIEKVRPLLVADDDFHIRSGLDFWFAPEGVHAALPVRWKQFLVTWSAIFPLVLIVPMLLVPMLEWLGPLQGHVVSNFVISGVIVYLMTYVVMPNYTKLIKRWLFR